MTAQLVQAAIPARRTRLNQEEQEALHKVILKCIEQGQTSTRDIGRVIGKSPDRTADYIRNMEKLGLVHRENGRIVKTEKQRSQESFERLAKDGFLKIPVVADWYHKMEGKVKDRDTKVAQLKAVCDALKMHPNQWLVDLTTSDNKFHDFEIAWKAEHGDVTLRPYRMAVRNFMLREGVSIPDSGTQYLGGEKENFGVYGDIYLSDRQCKQAYDYLKRFSDFDLVADNPIGRRPALAFGVGKEIFARPATLLQLRSNQVRFAQDDEGYPYATFEVYEGKTKKKFPKFVFDPEVLADLRKACSETPGYLFANAPELDSRVIRRLDSAFAQLVREAYGAIGIDITTPKFGALVNYYRFRPIYVLRHTGAWLWRRRGTPMEKEIAMGWDDPGTFTKVYAHLSASDLLQVGTCYVCKPPKVVDSNADPVFCTPRHALQYLNEHKEVTIPA
ncbi:MAG: hypothetical protein JRN62_10160 [Nitrososphaerota archaeon]|nr:hypothetical protein [Nitrososphaerota archaeon]MDG6949828.1 hypothetical protein [Nitrososphaerota archaeon]